MTREQRHVGINAVFLDKESRDVIVLRLPLGVEASVRHDGAACRYTRQRVEIPAERGEVVERSVVHHSKHGHFHRVAFIILHRHAPCLLRAGQDLVTLRVEGDVQLHVVERHVDIGEVAQLGVVFHQRHLEVQPSAVGFLHLVTELVDAVVQTHALRLQNLLATLHHHQRRHVLFSRADIIVDGLTWLGRGLVDARPTHRLIRHLLRFDIIHDIFCREGRKGVVNSTKLNDISRRRQFLVLQKLRLAIDIYNSLIYNIFCDIFFRIIIKFREISLKQDIVQNLSVEVAQISRISVYIIDFEYLIFDFGVCWLTAESPRADHQVVEFADVDDIVAVRQ